MRTVPWRDIEIPASELEFRPSVYGIVISDTRVLLLRYSTNGHRALPGGGIEKGETAAQALISEVKEEAGIDVSVNSFVAMKERFFYYDPKQKAYQAYLYYYRCTPLNTQTSSAFNSPDDAASEPEWVDIRDVRKEDFQINGDLLIDYLESCRATNNGQKR